MLAGVAIFVLSGFVWGPVVYHHLDRLYWEHQCMVYTAPSDQVVYEENRQRSVKLLATNSCYQRLSDPPFGVRYFHRAWNHVARHTTEPDAVVFVHQRGSPRGNVRLVGIDVYFEWVSPSGSNEHPSFSLCSDVLRPGGMTRSSKVMAYTFPFEFRRLQPSDELRIFAGQPDPVDASHFTIAYEMNSQKGIVDRWLQDDDTVKLKLRGGPAANP